MDSGLKFFYFVFESTNDVLTVLMLLRYFLIGCLYNWFLICIDGKHTFGLIYCLEELFVIVVEFWKYLLVCFVLLLSFCEGAVKSLWLFLELLLLLGDFLNQLSTLNFDFFVHHDHLT